MRTPLLLLEYRTKAAEEPTIAANTIMSRLVARKGIVARTELLRPEARTNMSIPIKQGARERSFALRPLPKRNSIAPAAQNAIAGNNKNVRANIFSSPLIPCTRRPETLDFEIV